MLAERHPCAYIECDYQRTKKSSTLRLREAVDNDYCLSETLAVEHFQMNLGRDLQNIETSPSETPMRDLTTFFVAAGDFFLILRHYFYRNTNSRKEQS